jgi:hypothetical protein
MKLIKQILWVAYISLFVNYQKKRFVEIGKTFSSLIGTFWTLIEITSYLLDSFQRKEGSNIYELSLRAFIWNNLFLEFLFFLILSIYLNRIKQKTIVSLNGSDLEIELKYCDIFLQNGAKIIPVVDTIDTDFKNNLVDPKTLHGIVISKFYSNKISILDNEISSSLLNTKSNPILNNDNLKGKKSKYEIGTTVILEPHQDYYYLTALTSMSETGNVQIQPSYLYEFLTNIWQFIPKHGKNFATINIPIIGKGINRLPPEYTHERILIEIVNSYMTSIRENAFCKKLRICIYYKESSYIDLEKITSYIEHQKKYNFI